MALLKKIGHLQDSVILLPPNKILVQIGAFAF